MKAAFGQLPFRMLDAVVKCGDLNLANALVARFPEGLARDRAEVLVLVAEAATAAPLDGLTLDGMLGQGQRTLTY